MTNVLSIVILLGLLIFVHELGHFLAARLVGVRCEVFSLGFGRKLLGYIRGRFVLHLKKRSIFLWQSSNSKRWRGGTHYVLSLLPLGGYVKISGQSQFDPDASGEAYELCTKPAWARFFVFFAGPLMNLILAFVLVYGVFVFGVPTPKYLYEEPVIGWIQADTPAMEMGLQVGDRILSINGKQIKTWEETYETYAYNFENELTLSVRRGREVLVLNYTKEKESEWIEIGPGIEPGLPTTLENIAPGYPAEQAGLKSGDTILEVNGAPVRSWQEMTSLIKSNADGPIAFLIDRGGEKLQFEATPAIDEISGRKIIGVSGKTESALIRYGPIEAIGLSLQKNIKDLKLMGIVLGRLVTGNLSMKALGSPIMIGKIAMDSAERGLVNYLLFMALISLNLGFLNLLPFPILDGGHILFLLFEVIFRKPINLRVQEIIFHVAFIFLISFFGLVILQDIKRFQIVSWFKNIVLNIIQ